MEKVKAKTLASDIAECALFVALMVAGAFIQIPFPLVPLTFQTVFAVLAGLMLGWKKGMIATGTYMIMGLIGIPVFTAGGGIYYVLKPSFGYIIGFVAASGVAGICYNREKKVWHYAILAVLAFLANYAVGIPYFALIYAVNQYEGLGAAIVTYNLLYMPKDLCLCLLAAILAWRTVPVVKKMRRKIKTPAAKPADETSGTDEN